MARAMAWRVGTGSSRNPDRHPTSSPFVTTGAEHDLDIDAEGRDVADQTVLGEPVQVSVHDPRDGALVHVHNLGRLLLGQSPAANHIVFLASPASSFTSGTNLLVDGAVTPGVQM